MIAFIALITVVLVLVYFASNLGIQEAQQGGSSLLVYSDENEPPFPGDGLGDMLRDNLRDDLLDGLRTEPTGLQYYGWGRDYGASEAYGYSYYGYGQ